jgi:cytochrome c553
MIVIQDPSMKKFAALFLAAGLAAGAHTTFAADEPDMIGTMGELQLFLHKLSLSVAAGNIELADFYAHELEESIEAAESIEAYHDIPVGRLTGSILTPSFERLEAAIDGGDADAIRSRMRGVIASCNGCHDATGYGFIRIAPSDANPYMQDFEPRD